jgi:hypothetical protein
MNPQLESQTLIIAVGMAFSAVTFIVSLMTGIAVLKLELRLTRQIDKRCKDCQETFVLRREFSVLQVLKGLLTGNTNV